MRPNALRPNAPSPTESCRLAPLDDARQNVPVNRRVRLPMATISDYSGRGKGQHDHADHGTADHRSGPALNSKDVPTFAPNFTVYLLPPDSVCLYSEHRKFFLYGELYCALASTIGEGKWTIGEIVRGLGRSFPEDKLREALTRLLDRGYILPDSPASTGVVAAYWASLGLSPQAVQKSLQECPRPHSIDRRAGCKGVFRRAQPARRSRRAARARPDRRAGARLSRRTPG